MKNKSQKLIPTTVLTLALCMGGLTYAQQNPLIAPALSPDNAVKIELYKANPIWKDMIDDPNANYFEVIKAFEIFWQGKELPITEDDIMSDPHKLKNNFINRLLNTKELREQEERETLIFDCKRYQNWLIMVEPYVQEDGRILSEMEKLEIWKKHYEELQQQ